jgi:hypothetical protein
MPVSLSLLHRYPIGTLTGVLSAILVIYGLAAYGDEELS